MDDAEDEDDAIRLESVEHDSVIADPQLLEGVGSSPDRFDVADVMAGGQALERLADLGPDGGGQFREFPSRSWREVNCVWVQAMSSMRTDCPAA